MSDNIISPNDADLLIHRFVTERIPIDEILALAAECTSDLLIVEFIGPSDPMFRRLTRGRNHLYEAISNESFATSCANSFQIIQSRRLAGTERWIYLLRKR